MKYKVYWDCDYVSGHLRSGHLKGEIEASSAEEAFKMVKDDPARLSLVVDDYEVEDYEVCGDPEIWMSLSWI